VKKLGCVRPLNPLTYKLQVAAYDTLEKKMAFFDPSRAKDFLFISGTKVRTLSHSRLPIEQLKLQGLETIQFALNGQVW
jgi:hypothetical protein